MAEKPAVSEVKAVQVGRNYNVKLGDGNFTLTGDKETLAPIKAAVETYKEKPTKVNKEALLRLLKPKTTEVEGMKERIAANKKATKKKIEEKAKENPKEKKAAVKKVVKDIEDKEYTETELEEMEKAINKAKAKKQQQAAPRTAPSAPKGREW